MPLSAWWIAPGLASLALFAWLLTFFDSNLAGRAYAAYGGVYIGASLVWLWAVEGSRPDRWDAIGALVCPRGRGHHSVRSARRLIRGPLPLCFGQSHAVAGDSPAG